MFHTKRVFRLTFTIGESTGESGMEKVLPQNERANEKTVLETHKYLEIVSLIMTQNNYRY